MGNTYRIAEVAERSGFTPVTLRYYEQIGLLAPAGRTGAGYRIYDDSSLERLRFIARAKQLCCSLDEVAELTSLWDGGRCRPVQDRLRATVAAKVAEARAQVASLTALADDLEAAAATLHVHTPDGPCDDACGCTADVPGAGGGSTGEPVPLITRANASRARRATGAPGAASSEADPPFACTLDTDAGARRRDEWHAVLAPTPDPSAGVTARVPLPDGVRLELGRATDVAEVARLAVAEQSCCAFFRFSLSVDHRGLALEVRAPAEAAGAGAALFGGPER